MCIVEKKDNSGIKTFVSIIILSMMVVSSLILFGIILLIKLHIRLTKYDFTTYEYIQYLYDRKDLEYKLKKKKISKDKFKELDMKARNNKFKKRSRIIKEVNEAKEKSIMSKVINKQKELTENMQSELEESKFKSNSKSGIRVCLIFHFQQFNMKSQNFDTEANGKEIALDHQMVDIENNTPDADFTKEYVYDPLHKKRNNFWCSSTF